MKVYQFDMKAYEFDTKAYQFEIKAHQLDNKKYHNLVTTLICVVWKYQFHMFENMNMIWQNKGSKTSFGILFSLCSMKIVGATGLGGLWPWINR